MLCKECLRCIQHIFLLARLFSKKTSRYCHSPSVVVGSVVVVVGGGGGVRKLTFSNFSVTTEDIYLKVKSSCSLSNREPMPEGEVILYFFDNVMPLYRFIIF